MSVKQRPNGKWRARYRDETGREYARHFATKREAVAWEAEKISSVARGTHMAPAGGRKTLREYAETTYLPRLEINRNTERNYKSAIDKCPFVDLPLNRITRQHVQDWIVTLRTGPVPLKSSTIRMYTGKIGAILNAATIDRLIPFNPYKGVKLPKIQKEPWDTQIPLVKHVKSMLERSHEPYTSMLASASFAGLRSGEILGLQPIDLRGPSTIRVSRQVSISRVMLPPTAPKYGSVRDATAPADLIRLLRKQAERVGAGPTDWIFPGVKPGCHMSYPSFYDAMREATKDWPEQMRHPHALRHFYASALIAAKCDVVTVSKSLGHANPSMTLDVYSHLWETSVDDVVNAASELMNLALPPAG
ncbi:tyrosine-type recombinase/integrase [Kocuria sp. HSID16901]|uniref:tyrosine-type recombinase/integrase n=1 Tax=Kocuria sp. HSID16901 TaxID=2419505 RepID=UPI0009E220D4|nr:tyrosine-type recombinase/integrase [Kocuria sp. HSID16901]MCT1367214.1 tyrosine-type recombinase/integrase [Rothia sp. p3-SID1597]RUQ23484.1 hypothetical protein D8M21_01935 [Kocuria sp. HSID16901]